METRSSSSLLDRLINMKPEGIYALLLGACSFVHGIFLLMFIVMQIVPLIIFNVISVGMYFALFLRADSISSEKYIAAIVSEITVHAVAATILVGWNSGFALYVMCLVPLIFYWPSISKKRAMGVSALFALVYIGVRGLMMSIDPVYPDIDISMERAAYFFNAFTAFLMLIILSMMFSSNIKRQQEMLSEQNETLRNLAGTDPLTGLMNRRRMYEVLADNAGRGYSLVLGDIDNFKSVNDTYGHNSGDEVLTAISEIIRENIPETACVCRWGGEEILILFCGGTLGEAADYAEKIRSAVERKDFCFGTDHPRITMTFGAAAAEDCHDQRSEQVIAAADRRLYIGKGSGKNCVVCKDK